MSRQSDRDNHANQLNPNSDAYWQSRGAGERPGDWDNRTQDSDNRTQEERKREETQKS